MFRFASPHYFWLLIVVVVMVVGYLYAVRRRRRALEAFGDPGAVAELMPEVSGIRVRHKFVVLCVACVLIICALARPQFGSKLREERRTGIEIMVAVDVSNSMLAQDFEPNRLERTKFAINRLIEQLDEDRIGLIVFAGDAYIQLPITSDYLTARSFARTISTDMVSRQGTSLSTAISLAASSFSEGSEGSRVLIIISDGEDHEEGAMPAAEEAAARGIVIYTIGIGTPEGAPIPVGSGFLEDEEGNMVVTKLNESLLQQIAVATGGSYIRATNRSIGLDEIVQRINEIEKRHLKTPVFEEYNEQFPYLLGAALILLLIESAMLSRRNRILARLPLFRQR